MLRHMNRSIDRYCEAVVVGCAISVIVGVIGAILSLFKSGCVHAALENSFVFAVFSFIPSALSSSMGMTLRRFDRACAYGAVVFLSVTYLGFEYWYHWIILVDLYRRDHHGWITCVNMISFTAIFGALTGSAGAVMGRSVSDDCAGASRLQLSKRELMVVSVLMGIEVLYMFLAV
jgi:hypothetical protein